MEDEPIDIEALRRRAREQRERQPASARTECVFVRRDGSGFRESDGNGADEYGAEHVYPPEVHSGCLGRRGVTF